MTAPLSPSDDELCRRLLSGDEDAFVMLYRRHRDATYRFALRMGVGEAAAADVTQEVFTALMNNPRAFDPSRGTLRSFLLGIARHHVFRLFSRDGREIVDDASPSPSDDDPASSLVHHDRVDDVREAIAALPPAQREVVLLCDMLGFSYEEAAASMGCPVGTVRSRLHRAHARLVEWLGEPAGVVAPASSGEVLS